jgi:hypothetical protein
MHRFSAMNLGRGLVPRASAGPQLNDAPQGDDAGPDRPTPLTVGDGVMAQQAVTDAIVRACVLGSGRSEEPARRPLRRNASRLRWTADRPTRALTSWPVAAPLPDPGSYRISSSVTWPDDSAVGKFLRANLGLPGRPDKERQTDVWNHGRRRRLAERSAGS